MARRGSALPKVLGGIAFFVVAVIVIALAATSGPADAVTAHMTALAKGDDAAAYVWLEKTNTWHLVARMSVTLTP